MTRDTQKLANDLINSYLHQHYDRRHEWPADADDDDQAVDAAQPATPATPQTADQRLNELIRGLSRRRGE